MFRFNAAIDRILVFSCVEEFISPVKESADLRVGDMVSPEVREKWKTEAMLLIGEILSLVSFARNVNLSHSRQ